MALPDCVLTGGRVVLPRSVLEGGAIVVKHGKISAVLEAGDRLPSSLPRRDLGRSWITPGLVELHIHGCGGVAFDALGGGSGDADPASGAEALLRAAAFLRARGVTTFVPTVISREASISALAAALDELSPSHEEVPGIYVEGPFVNPARRGGIPLDALSEPDTRLLGHMINLARGRLALMTLAPNSRATARHWRGWRRWASCPASGIRTATSIASSFRLADSRSPTSSTRCRRSRTSSPAWPCFPSSTIGHSWSSIPTAPT